MPKKPNPRHSRIWRKLASWYGARLVEQFGEEMPEDWRELVDKTDDTRLHAALLNVRRASPAHPPTLGQLEMCIPLPTRATTRSTGEELIELATKTLKPCKHQLASGWPTLYDGLGTVSAIVVPTCTIDGCGAPGRKFKREELLA